MNWASNTIKLQRAIAVCGPNATEDQIKETYIKMGGLVLDYAHEIKEAVVADNPAVTITEESIPVPPPMEAPKKVAKKATKKTK